MGLLQSEILYKSKKDNFLILLDSRFREDDKKVGLKYSPLWIVQMKYKEEAVFMERKFYLKGISSVLR